MSHPKYIVGIDLGTTHCVVAYTRADHDPHEEPEIRLFEIPQVVSPGEVKAQPLLPSFLFLPGPHDVPEGALALPWQPDATEAVGEYARERGAEIPNRLVASAKSWLSHAGVDRTAPILPWDAPEDARRVSPVEAATRYLAHIRGAWNHLMAATDPEARLEAQEIYLTVPASFDAVARELTVQAARAAGLEHLTLLEEPQAAFYAWLEARGDAWREDIHVGESVLVCDVGGGTTDFSLIEVVEEDGNLDLRRAAVGDHILLGGDNMDLTLAYAVRARLAQQGTRLDNWQFRALVHSCRKAKERLLSHPDLEAEPVVIPGRGSSLIGGTIRTELTRQEIEAILVQGFFPETAPDAFPERKPKVGMREMGLPYESDPAITRHLAYFLHRQAGTEGGPAFPSAVLFNGGVMKAGVLREQVLRVLRQWSGNDALRALPSVDLDQAVALGAAYYGLARKGRGIRIRAGTAQTYYIGVESAMPAVPGIPTPMKALCVVPFGMEEGTEADIRGKEFGLVVGEQAVFHLLASNTRKTDAPGEIIEDWDGELHEVTTMEAMLPATDAEGGGTVLPVWLHSKVTEVGTLELWCVARDGDRRWKLEFNLREGQESAPAPESQA
ncbi:MAG: Hsp70 family protein [Bacteroidetes bacterium]|nr:MAG: Hsp70 family protein [Bacteroidota bacterium]GIV57914.1 MAG: heat-shock protein [Rhodothermaceae bacterium]